MSNLIPPLLSSSPPPITGPSDEEDEDEFGDFRTAADPYDCDDLSLPPSPQKSSKSDFSEVSLDVNSNSQNIKSTEMPSQSESKSIEKDYQDRRKSLDESVCENQVNSSDSQSEIVHYPDTNSKVEPTETNDQISVIVDKFESQDDLNSFNEDLSESVHLDEELSELNEINDIKSEDEVTTGDDFKEDKFDGSLKDCENSELSTSLKAEIDDEFGDFEGHFTNSEKDKVSVEDEFDDFISPLPPSASNVEVKDEDFGDFESSEFTKSDGEFGDFSTHFEQNCEKSVTMDINVKNAAFKSETILKEIFSPLEIEFENFDCIDETKGNLIFEELKDVTETNALLYQWSKSNSQKMFLKALNIDTRNILYGPAWNCSMPRFASNLGVTPLEPIKTDILTPTPVQQNTSSPSSSSQKNSGDIPSAQFDWNSSGLINPLDSSSIEPPGNVPEDTTQSQIKTDFLPNQSENTSTLPSLFASTDQNSTNHEAAKPSDDQSEVFTPFQSPKVAFPLRETHISNETLNEIANKPGWLEPTILTPDLPRREPVVNFDDDDDEFDDFQMVLPAQKTVLTEQKPPEIDNKLKQPTFPDLTVFEQRIPPSTSEDEEFTDFQSGGILTPLTPLQPVPLEPLRPSVAHEAQPAQINWPEPGVTDEDVRNIELTYSRKAEASEDDEWSDFVSVTSPAKPAERTATPDLPLSVLALGQVQAPKQPTPVVTPTGLVQTRLRSNARVVQTGYPPISRAQQQPLQPSIISNLLPVNGAEDDDWSEFVSSQPIANGCQRAANQKGQNWTGATTNIIMNPSHFESFYVPQQGKKSAVQGVAAMPDLEFIGTKSRTKK